MKLDIVKYDRGKHLSEKIRNNRRTAKRYMTIIGEMEYSKFSVDDLIDTINQIENTNYKNKNNISNNDMRCVLIASSNEEGGTIYYIPIIGGSTFSGSGIIDTLQLRSSNHSIIPLSLDEEKE